MSKKLLNFFINISDSVFNNIIIESNKTQNLIKAIEKIVY